jgi:hypothetical protein
MSLLGGDAPTYKTPLNSSLPRPRPKGGSQKDLPSRFRTAKSSDKPNAGSQKGAYVSRFAGARDEAFQKAQTTVGQSTPAAPQLPPPSTAASTRRSSGGGSMPAAVTRKPASTTPKAPAAPAKPGQKFEDFNPNRGTSKSNNPLLDRDKGGIKLRDRMKERENRGGMKNFNTDVDVKADSPKSEDYSKANTSNQTSTAYRLNKLMGDKKKKKGY